KVIPLLGEHDDGSAFRSLVRQRGKLRDIGKMTLFDAGRWKELRGGPVSQSDRSRLVQQQHIYVARGFNSAPRHGDDVPLNHAVQEGFARIRGDADFDLVGENTSSPGNCRAIAARLPDDWRGLAGDRRFIDGGHTFDHLAITRNEVPCSDDYDVP